MKHKPNPLGLGALTKPRLPSEGIYQDSNTGFNNLAIVFYDDIVTIYLDGISRDT